GMQNQKVVPRPLSLLRTPTLPPCPSTTSLQIASPSPLPPCLAECSPGTCSKGAKITSRYCGGMPGPSSLTDSWTSPALSLISIDTVESGGEYFKALDR